MTRSPSAQRSPARASQMHMRSPLLVHALGAGACGLAALVWYVGFAMPHMRDGEDYRSDRARLSASAEAVTMLEAERNKLREVIAEQESQFASAKCVLSPLAGVNAKIAEITSLASVHGVRVESLKPGQPASTALATRVPIQITGLCESADAVRFLASVRATLPDVAVDGFLVSAPTGDSTGARVEIELTWYAERAGDSEPTRAQVP